MICKREMRGYNKANEEKQSEKKLSQPRELNITYNVYVHESPVVLFVEPRDDRQFHQNTSPDHNNNKSETTISFWLHY